MNTFVIILKTYMKKIILFMATLLFIGCAVGYAVVFPLTLRFLYTYQLSATISN